MLSIQSINQFLSTPFNITEPLFNKLCSERFRSAVLLVGDRYASNVQCYKVGDIQNTSPSRLAILTNAFFDSKYYMQVPSGDFSPEPSVNGTLLALIPSKKRNLSFKDYVFRNIWDQRTRPLKYSISNGIENYLSLEGNICYMDSDRIMGIISLPDDLVEERGSDLGNSDFLKIYICLSDKKNKKRIYKTNKNISERYRN